MNLKKRPDISKFYKDQEIKNCPDCGETDLYAKHCCAWAGGEHFVSVLVQCIKCGKRYWNKHYVPPQEYGPLIILPRCNR